QEYAHCSFFSSSRRRHTRVQGDWSSDVCSSDLPYHIVIVYWRSAFAELLAAALLPVLLLNVLRSEQEGSKAILPLGLIVGAAWLTNVPSAVMVTYSLALLMGIIAITRRSVWPLFIAAGALALGLMLAAFYIVPAAYE